MNCLVFIWILIQTSNAFGQSWWTPETEPRFAPEFEFRDKTGRDAAKAFALSPKSSATAGKLTAFEIARNATIQTILSAWPQEAPDRHWSNEGGTILYYLRDPKDPMSVIRVAFTTDPFVIETKLRGWPTLKRLEQLSEVGQKYIFDQLEGFGYTPPEWATGGHVNLFIPPSFGVDAKVGLKNLLNFIVDYVDHDFSFGTFLYDPRNALPYRDGVHRALKYRSAVKKIRALIDEDKTKQAAAEMERFFVKTYGRKKPSNELSVKIYLSEDSKMIMRGSRLEIRGIRAQKNFAEFVDLAAIFRARIFYLRKNYSDRWVPLTLLPPNRSLVNMKAFKRYVEEPGLDFKKYRYIALRGYNACNYILTPVKWLGLGIF